MIKIETSLSTFTSSLLIKISPARSFFFYNNGKKNIGYGVRNNHIHIDYVVSNCTKLIGHVVHC
jgi:hypothetical protein